MKDNNNIAAVRQNCDLPFIGKIIECRREKFISKLLDSQFLSCLFWFYLVSLLCFYCWTVISVSSSSMFRCFMRNKDIYLLPVFLIMFILRLLACILSCRNKRILILNIDWFVHSQYSLPGRRNRVIRRLTAATMLLIAARRRRTSKFRQCNERHAS